MAKKKSVVKAKEPVKIRFKSIAGGGKSIYLDIYQDGQRRYVFPKLYLVPETTPEAKTQNANTLQAVNAIKSQLIIDIANNEAGIRTNPAKAKMLLIDWLDMYQNDRQKKGKRIGAIIPNLKKILKAYKADKVTLQSVNKRFCMNFIEYMADEYVTQYGQKLSPLTAQGYCSMLSTILKAAVTAGLIAENPFDKIPSGERIKGAESKREYLTAKELQTLIDTPFPELGRVRAVNGNIYGGRDIKTAFLFSCFTGLRLSDIKALKWSNIVNNDGQWSIDGIIIKKTQRPHYLPLSGEALKYLPERGEAGDDDFVFNLPNSDGFTDMKIKMWAESAGLNKKVTFHVARHTNATLLLTAGADLYTVSKLLGHKNVATTQVYAKIVNSKKIEAVNMLDGLFK